MKLNSKTIGLIVIAIVAGIVGITMLGGQSQEGGEINIGGGDGNVTIGTLDQSQNQEDNDTTDIENNIENKQNVEETIIENRDILNNTQRIENAINVNNEEVIDKIDTLSDSLGLD